MRYYFFYMLLSLTLTLNSQGFRVRHYLQNTSTNLSKAIFETTPGNYITGGITVETINNISCNRLCIMGLNAQGQITWTKKYGNDKFEYLTNNLTTRSFYKQGNYIYFVGCVRDSLNKQIGVLIKFNSSGDTLWQKTYRDSDPLEDVIPQMVTGSVDGGFLITGFFQNSGNSPYRKCMVIKTDVNGTELWRQKIAKLTPNTQDGKAIVQDALSKKIVIVGYQYIGNANSWGNYESVLILDSLGTKLSQHNYAGYGGVLFDLIQTQDGKFVAAGIAIYPQTLGGYNLNKSYIVKFDVNSPSNPIWMINNFDRLSLTNAFHSLVELTNGEILVGGVLDTLQVNNMNTNSFVRLTKFSSSGAVTWNKNYDYKVNSPTSDNVLAVRSINLTSDGSWIAALESFNFPSPNPFFFVKFDSTGCDSTLAYCQSQVISGVYQTTLNDVSVEVFPNPVTDYLTVNIPVGIATEDTWSLKIRDLTGRELKTMRLIDETNILDMNGLPEGIYLLVISKNGSPAYTMKLVKQE